MNKKGSITIFATVIFVAFTILIFALISNAKSIAISGCAKQLSRVWGNSILGEYDKNLFKEYGIMGFYGYESTVNDDLRYYINQTIDDKEYIEVNEISSKLSNYLLIDTENFKKQLIEAAKISLTDIGEAIDSKQMQRERPEAREINNKRILESLPSSGATDTSSVLDFIDNIKNVSDDGSLIESAGNAFYIQKYISYYFDDHINQTSKGNPYFRNEKEYILVGKNTDEKNLDGFKTKFVLARNAINLAYLYTDSIKQEATMALAQVLTPGPAAIATQVVLNETWAYLEAKNDWKLLIKGKKVPVLKTKENWALDEGVLKIQNYDDFVDNNSETGLTYENYLNLFLTFQNEKITLLRIMDLIQINMKFNHYKDFLISEYNIGLDFVININGENYEYTKQY